MSKEFTAERDRFQQLCINTQKMAAAIEEKTAAESNRSLIGQYAQIDHLTREAVEILIDHISVGRRIPAQEMFRLKFTGTFNKKLFL